MDDIAVIGAGNSGFAMAGHLISRGRRVRLWNRPGNDCFAGIKAAGGITMSGRITGRYLPQLLTHDMGQALAGVRLILVTVPAHVHASVIQRMAPHLLDGQILVLNPGRTCGAMEAQQVLSRFAHRVDVTVAETQTIVYTCRKTGPAGCAILALKRNVALAALDPSRTHEVLHALPDCLRDHFVPAASTLETSLGNVGMILHCVPVLLNAGWIEAGRTAFKYYYEAITPTVARFLERLDEERLSVARACGCEVPGICEWLHRVYQIEGANLYECIQANASYATIDAPKSLDHRYLYEDVPTGLVPLEAIGKAMGLPMKLTTLVIDLANHLLGRDFRRSGRGRQALGLAGLSQSEVASRLAA